MKWIGGALERQGKANEARLERLRYEQEAEKGFR